jgi:hypothetical protein
MKTALWKAALWMSALALAALGTAIVLPMNAHDDADLSTRRASKTGMYEVSYAPEVSPVPKRKLHSWTVELRTRDGRPVDGARIAVDGGMPDHGHGLPTRPAVREALGDGRYVIDGVKFNMGGYWVVDLAIESEHGADTVRFELKL